MSYTCPRCQMTSHNPTDEAEGYCGNCHDWTRDTSCEYPCDRCSAQATVVQAKYRGNPDDRHGPIVLYRCDRHRVDGLETTLLSELQNLAQYVKRPTR